MFVLLPKMCRSFFLPVLYEISFNLIKQKATKVKKSTKKQTYRHSRIARSSFKNFEIEIKQQKKKKKKIAAPVSPSPAFVTFLRQSCGYSSRHQRCRKTRAAAQERTSSSPVLALLTTFKYSSN